MENKLLLIIDPQIDFITGSLPVPGAEKAMNELSEYIRLHGPEYASVIVTADRHPMRHCSFISEGGKWPAHCVADSVGAAIWPSLMDELFAMPDKVTVLHKGENPATEEYSIFKNKDAAQDIFRIIDSKDIDEIDICGIAGDVCVSDTIRDWMKLGRKPKMRVLTRFSPSIDGGTTLDGLIQEYRLSRIG